jgi:hypothetical protein
MREARSLLSLFRAPGWLLFLATYLTCLTILIGWLFLPATALTALVGIAVSILVGFVAVQSRRFWSAEQSPVLETSLELAGDRDVFDRFRLLSLSLLLISRRRDPIFLEIALEHLDELVRRTATIAEGTFVFEGTETWRIVYERLLRSPGLHLYRSVAWVKNANYWQDEPGRKSMAVNFELHEGERLNIERIAIIADELWPEGDVWPAELLRQWLHEQHVSGIWVKFVRQSALAKEPDLIADIGIYGSRAFGIQELDEQCRTIRFTLTFDFSNVAAAEDRWKRLAVYAESFAGYLDRYEMPG